MVNNFNNIWKYSFKMNKVIKKFLFTGGMFISKLHVRQLGILMVLMERLLNIVKGLKYSKKEIV